MLLYPIAFIVALSSLALWFFSQNNKSNSAFFSGLFYLAFGAWAISFFLADASMDTKIPVLVRDLLMMAGIPIMLQSFSKNKGVFFGLLMLLIGLYYGFGWDIWAGSFKENKHITEEPKKIVNNENDNTFELLVEVKNDRQSSDLQEIKAKYGLSIETAFVVKDGISTDLDDYIAINIPTQLLSSQEAIISDLQSSGLIDWVEENETIKIDDPITDLRRLPAVNRKFGVNDPELKRQWALKELNADKLYSYFKENKVKPTKKARIFILDTGVDAQHEDLAKRYRSVKSEYDKDVQGHGTHCAGIAGAVTDNNKGIASLSPTNDFIEISSVKVLSDFGGGTQRTIINGIIEAADNGADVISMSLGGRSTDSKQRAYKQAIDYANKKGAIVVVAAGNSNANSKNYAPAGAPGVICVSAIDTTLSRANFSNYVQDVKMGIAAPGTLIHSTIPKNQYKAFNGTSMATPYVAGLIGLMKSLKPELTTKEAFKILEKSGKDTKSVKETGMFIQPEAAIRMLLEK
jgi:thermitase